MDADEAAASPPPPPPYELASSLQLAVFCEPLAQDRRDGPQVSPPAQLSGVAQLTATTGAPSTTMRAPIDCVCVIDTSHSMMAQKPLVVQSLHFIIGQLSQRDRFGLVCFGTDARNTMRLCTMDTSGRARAHSVAAQLSATETGGATNISGGLLSGLMQLLDANRADVADSSEASAHAARPTCSAGHPRVRSVLLFTDGRPTVGIMDPENMCEAVRRLMAEIGGHSCVFTFGLGPDHDSGLLHELACAGGGLFYFLPDISTLAPNIAQCIGGLLRYAGWRGRDARSRCRPC